MALTQVPGHTSLSDGQFVQITGPDGLTTGYQYDAQQRALYFKESQILFPSFHGATHIAEDPVPDATCDTPGLMSSDDKCKLDSLVGTRLGVLGFQGAGFPDDGGWLQGDIILAAGTEFISLERVGNVIRFTVDSPVPLNCDCEECQQIYWVQDETDLNAIRPPTCGGKLPGVNAYGELKVYAFPESTIVDPSNASATLQNKGEYPAFIFKRYDDSIVPGAAEHEMILKRDEVNSLQTEVGWAMTPGAAGVAEMVWFMGKDNDGGQIRFDLEPESEPGLLGALLYNGHLITKKMAVVTDYSSTILSTNQYTVKEWNVDNNEAIGDSFTATNVWQYTNPENPQSGSNPQQLVLDATIDLLPIGSLVSLWSFKVGEVSGEPILRHYFSQRPRLNPQHMWSWAAQQQFGDVAIAREESTPTGGSEDKDAAVQVSAIRTIDRHLWGVTGFDDPLFSADIAASSGTNAADITEQHRALIDTSLPGLVVQSFTGTLHDNFSERPVWVWNRRNLKNKIVRLDIGRPDSSTFTPYDIVLRAPIDEHTNKYMRVLGTGVLNGLNYVRVCGVHFHDLPPFGAVRILDPFSNEDQIYNYSRKFMFPSELIEGTGTEPVTEPCDSIILTGDASNNPVYPGATGDIVELLHQEYSSLVVRLEFSYNTSTELVELQFKIGTLDMSVPYENDIVDDVDDYVRGLAAGYTVSAVYSQSGTFTGVGSQPESAPDDFVVYDGGAQVGGDESEYWNRIEIMVRDDQVWVWWNQLLIPPSTTLSAALPTPVTVSSPYFPIEVDPNQEFGKTGVRMWPGASLRRFDIRSQLSSFSEFAYGQLEVV